jgi:hypothetical protein
MLCPVHKYLCDVYWYCQMKKNEWSWKFWKRASTNFKVFGLTPIRTRTHDIPHSRKTYKHVLKMTRCGVAIIQERKVKRKHLFMSHCAFYHIHVYNITKLKQNVTESVAYSLACSPRVRYIVSSSSDRGQTKYFKIGTCCFSEKAQWDINKCFLFTFLSWIMATPQRVIFNTCLYVFNLRLMTVYHS